MAKKSAKKVAARKSSKSAAAAKGRQSAKKATVKKSARAGGSYVSFGLNGMTTIMQVISEAGLEPEFNKAMRHDDKFVKVQRESLRNIKEFVASKPKLARLAEKMQKCDCDPA